MLDTHEFIKALKTAGFPEIQAETLVGQLRKSEESSLANLATKQDLQEVKRDLSEVKRDLMEVHASLQRDMKEMETGLEYKMKEMELRLTIKLGAMLAASIAIVAALVKLL